MKAYIVLFTTVLFEWAQAQPAIQKSFCSNLNKVMQSGVYDNFESVSASTVKQSPFLAVPGSPVKLPGFPVTYVDKDQRFVAKTNVNTDSLGAIVLLDSLRMQAAACMDSSWQWESIFLQNDSSTLFFNEIRYYQAQSPQLRLQVAMVEAARNVYTCVMYVRRQPKTARR